MILHLIKQVWWSARSAWERLSVRIRGGLATGRASRGRIRRLARARQFWQEQESCRNPEESKGIRSNLVEIQEFLSRRNSCEKFLKKWLKTGIPKTPPKPRSCEQIPPKNGKKILRNPVFFCFSVQKINSCQTGITNLVLSQVTVTWLSVTQYVVDVINVLTTISSWMFC
jgi:hypothetical protein